MGILRFDAQGLCTYANEIWRDISGLSLTDTLGRSWSQAVHPDDLPQVMAKWEESVRLQQPYVNEVRLLRPDGSQRRVLAGACPTRDEQGAVAGFVGTLVDVARLDQASRELAERERLLRALIDVEMRFASGIDAIPPALQTTVYRLVQESLNNVRKHSGSERVELAAVRSSVDTELGKGTRIAISLPVAGPQEPGSAGTGSETRRSVPRDPVTA